jgi:ankyrin repeat protein
MEVHGGVISTTSRVWSMLSAAADGHLGRVASLAAETPALVTCQYDYTAPLHLAVRAGHESVVSFLVEHGAVDPEYRVHVFRDTLVTLASDRGFRAIAAMLLDALADPTRHTARGDTGAIDRGRSAAQIHFEDRVSASDVAAAIALLADDPALALDHDAFWGEGVLAVPANHRDFAMVDALLAHGATVPPDSKWGARYYFKHADMAAHLLASGMNPNHRSWRGFSLLHDVAFTGETDKVRLLLEHGATLDAIDDEYASTPLGYAAHWNRMDAAQLLVDRGADVHAAGAPWATPLAWAERYGHSATVSLLRAYGARA